MNKYFVFVVGFGCLAFISFMAFASYLVKQNAETDRAAISKGFRKAYISGWLKD